MAANGLIDTGAIVAMLDRNDRWHSACSAAFRQMRLPLLTSQAVLTELFHLIGDSRRDIGAAWNFIRSAIVLGPISGAELPDLEALMARYNDRPMDFADATLVHLAQREAIVTIFTVDHANFETYRIGGKTKFKVVPNRSSA